MKVIVEGSNAEALRKALKKLRTPTSRMHWISVSKESDRWLCSVKEATLEEEHQILYYGELR